VAAFAGNYLHPLICVVNAAKFEVAAPAANAYG